MLVRLFGPLELEVNGRVLRHSQFGGVKARQILEILAIHRGRVVAKLSLAERLWRERPPLAVEAAIETHVSLLRRALEEPGAVETASRGYRLGPVEVDLEVFDELVARGTLDSLTRAIALARGEVGQHDAAAAWFRGPREQYGHRLTEVLSRAGRLALEQGEPRLAAVNSARALARDPLREVDYQTLIAATYVSGDRSASLRTFERCRQILSKQLGCNPGSMTNALHRSVLLGLPLDLALGAGGQAGPRALVIEPHGLRQGALIQACGEAGFTSELVVDLDSALARLGSRRYQLVVMSERVAAVAGLEAAGSGTVVVAGPDLDREELAALFSTAATKEAQYLPA